MRHDFAFPWALVGLPSAAALMASLHLRQAAWRRVAVPQWRVFLPSLRAVADHKTSMSGGWEPRADRSSVLLTLALA